MRPEAGGFLTSAELASMLGFTPRTIRAMACRGDLPRPIRLSRKRHLWDREKVENFLRDRGRGRR